MSFAELLVWIVPLTLLSAVSPMMLVQAATIRLQHGLRGNLEFLAGITVVFAALGIAGMGMLGVAAAHWAEAELASKRVDAVLATLLAGYGGYLVVVRLKDRGSGRHQKPRNAQGAVDIDKAHERPPVVIPARGLFFFGLLTTATDLTGLPIYLSIAQKIGAASIGWPLKIATLIGSCAVIVSPAWLPLALHRWEGYQSLVSRVSQPLATLSWWAALLGSFAGAGLLYWHALS